MFLIKRVRFKNFRSYGNHMTEVDLCRNKTTVITAPNGFGKSTIMHAVEFGLFGKVSGGIKKTELPNDVNNKDCLVEVACSVGGKEILVRRGIKPNLFEVFVDGVLMDQTAALAYQSTFEETVLGFNFNSFRQVVSINGSYTPFMKLEAADRRKLVEGVLDLAIFSAMQKEHNGNVSRNRESVQSIDAAINASTESIASLKKGLDAVVSKDAEIREQAQDNINDAIIKIGEIEDENTKIDAEIDALKERTSILSDKRAQRDKMSNYARDIRAKMSDATTFVKFLDENDHCPTCKQDIDAAFKHQTKQERTDKIAELGTGLTKLKSMIDVAMDEVVTLEALVAEMRSLTTKREVGGSKITELRRYIKTVEDSMRKQGRATADSLKDDIIVKSEEVTKLRNTRLELLEEKQYNDLIAGIIKDNGIKSSVVKQYITKMNQLINQYLETMSLGVSFSMDESFNATILSRHCDERSYESFSAGERARMDIAILFTWRDIARIKNSLKCNILFIDEAFDERLDTDGLESFINLLSELPETNVFMISHRHEVVDKFHSNIRVTKQGNFSRIDL